MVLIVSASVCSCATLILFIFTFCLQLGEQLAA